MKINFPNLPIEITKEEGLYTVICRSLEISGYGETIESAQESFKIVFESIMTYLIENNELEADLLEHGYKLENGVATPENEFIGSKTLNLEIA